MIVCDACADRLDALTRQLKAERDQLRTAKCGEFCGEEANPGPGCVVCAAHGVCHLCETEQHGREKDALRDQLDEANRLKSAAYKAVVDRDGWLEAKEAQLAVAREEIERLRGVIRSHCAELRRDLSMDPAVPAAIVHRDLKPDNIDLDLLRKLASGEGGRRTGALRMAGLLEWRVTIAGRRAIAAADDAKETP